MDNFQFENLTPGNFDKLKAYLRHNNCTGLEGNEGSAIGHCLDLAYRFDPATGTLDLSAQRLPENLQALPPELRVKAGSRLLANAMGVGRPARPMALAATATYPNKPNRYGVYDYVTAWVTNSTGHAFTFKDQSLDHGTMFSYAGTIDANASVAQIFEADSAKLSGVGVGGSVDYVWADNTTVMTISFFLNTIYTHTFTVGFSTTALTSSVTDTDPSLDGYTYLNPQITITT